LVLRLIKLLKRYSCDSNDLEGDKTFKSSPEVYSLLIGVISVLCNIVLHFSSMKEKVIEGGILPILVALAGEISDNANQNADKFEVEYKKSPGKLYDEMFLLAGIALKNILFQASLDVKRQVCEAIGLPKFRSILTDKNISVERRITAMAILRNLLCGKDGQVAYVNSFFGRALLDIIQNAISLCVEEGSRPNAPTAILQEWLVHALYTLANMCTGSTDLKNDLCAYPVLLDIIRGVIMAAMPEDERNRNAGFVFNNVSNSVPCLTIPKALVNVDTVVAALWCIINVTWRSSPDDNERDKWRLQVLSDLGNLTYILFK
jgi:hypothetical protein